MTLFKSKTDVRPDIKLLIRAETKFNNIMAVQNGKFREIWFVRNNDFFLQSRIDAENPYSLALVYSQMMMAGLLLQPAPKRILMIGLGGSAVTNCLNQWFPETLIDVVEIDGRIVEISREYFFLRESERYRVHEQDGRVFVQSMRGKEKYDWIFLDAFKSGSIPYHLKTAEFYGEISGLLAPGGVVSSNLYGKSNRLKPRDLATFAGVFKQIYLFEDPDEVATVLHATNQARKWAPEDMNRAAAEFMSSQQIPLSMHDIAAMYRPGKFEEYETSAFNDNFSEDHFIQAVERNNDNRTWNCPYPIKSSG